jgi:hypothetical protein
VRDERFHKTLIIFWSIFWASSFIKSNTWHLICNNFNLNFIYVIVCLYVCACAFSLHRESPDMISGDKPLISEVVLSQLVSEQDWGKTQMKASKNHNNVFRWGTLSPYKDYSSLFRWLANLCVLLCNCAIASMKVFLIFVVFTKFCCWWPYFVVCSLCRTIRVCWCLFLLFMDIFGCLCLDVRTWSGYFGTGPLWTWVKNDDWFIHLLQVHKLTLKW